MPVHNAQAFVGEAINSILGQTLSDFEFIIVDDGSTDGSGDVIASFNDPRIKHISIENRGIAGALNEAISQSTAPLIARMDADDVSLPERLEQQVEFLERDPAIGLVGTWATVMNTDGTKRGVLHHPTDHAALQFALLFHTPFVHPSVLFRRVVFEQAGGYDPRPRNLEDYDLWSRMARITRLANIPKELIRYRAVPSGFSHTNQEDTSHRLVHQRTLNWKALVPRISERELELAVHMGLRHSKVTVKELIRIRELLHTQIEGWTTDHQERKVLKDLARSYLMGFHVIEHSNLAGKALDRSIKQIALDLPFKS